MAAYEYVLAGKVLHHRSLREANAEAMSMLEKAIALDPKYAHAHAWKACVLGQRFVYSWFDDAEALLKAITGELEIALSLDENDADVHRILAAIHLTFNRFDRATYHQERALALSPNYDLVVVQQGETLTWLGRPEEGIEWIRKAMRLNPYHPERFWSHLGRAQFTAKAYGDAIQSYSHINQPDQVHHAFMAAAAAAMGDTTAAGAHMREVLTRAPGFTVTAFLATLHYSRAEDTGHCREALLKAGLPE
jgi:adenylate cyclase